MARAVPCRFRRADIASSMAARQGSYYLTTRAQMIDGPLPGEKSAFHVYDMKERKDHVLVEGLDSYSLSADGEKVLYKKHDKVDGTDLAIADAEGREGKAETDEEEARSRPIMRDALDPHQEWAEMFNNAWRLERDLFVNPEDERRRLGRRCMMPMPKLLPLVGSREDLNYLIGEMLGEISNSHTYVGGGDDGDPTTNRYPPPCSASTGRSTRPRAVIASRRSIPATTPARLPQPADPTRHQRQGGRLSAGGQRPAELKAPTDPDSLLRSPIRTTTVDADASPTAPTAPARRRRSSRSTRSWPARGRPGSSTIARSSTSSRAASSAMSICPTWSNWVCSSSCASSTRSSTSRR